MERKVALLVIDVQKAYSLNDSEIKVQNFESVLENINKVIEKFTRQNEPIIYIRHIHEPDGSDSGRMFDLNGQQGELGFVKYTPETEYIDGLLKSENFTEIIKNRYNSFANTNLHEILKSMGVEKVVIVGFMTNFCCESTARAAHDRDYYVDFILDATGTPDLETLNQEQIKEATAATLSAGYANILSTEEFIKA